MRIQVQFQSGVPVYLQIVQQVKSAAAGGTLRPGESLPSVRTLAEELRINRNTVARAYTELESDGVIETRQGSGCFLKANGESPLSKSVRQERLLAGIDALIVEAHHFGITDVELKRLLADRLTQNRSQSASH